MTDYSKETIVCVDSLISNYAIFDRDSECYELWYSDLPEIAQQEICAFLLADDEDFSNSSTGVDNPEFTSKMLPALIKLMKDSRDETQEDFIEAYRKGIIGYAETTVDELLEWRLKVYTDYMKYEHYEDDSFPHQEDAA